MYIELSINSIYALLTQIFKEQPIKAKINTHHVLVFAIISKWWRMTGSNRRPPACKAGALPAELIPQLILVARLAADLWWVWKDLNLRPPPYQDGALTT